MFGLSLAETIVILLVAVLVIGPKELPTVIRAAIRTMAQVRALGNEFKKNFDELAKDAELHTLKQEVETIARPVIIDLEGRPQPTYDLADLTADKNTALPVSKPDEGVP